MIDLLESETTHGVVAGLALVLFAITNLPWNLDNYDQAKQAFTSFEMVEEGHWLYQHTPKERVATKPPLVGWISAASYTVTRSWEVAWRLPSIVAAAALLIFLRRAAANAYGTTAGLLAMSAFGLNLLTPRLATLVRTDMPLALIVFLLGCKIWDKLRRREAWEARDRLVMFVLLTAAMLVKGPIVYAFLLPGIVVFQWRAWKLKLSTSAWCGWWPWVASLAIFLLWVAGGIAWTPQFYEEVVLREFAGRFSETVHRPQPLYFYVPHLLHKFAPWSILALLLAFLDFRLARTTVREWCSRISPETRWLVYWSLGGLLLMSLIPSKRVDRIFPIIPPLCLLLAAQLSRLLQDDELRARLQRWTWAALVFACLFTSAYAAQKIVLASRAQPYGELAAFGRAVRAEAVRERWRYGVIGGRHEGLLLYLRRTHFLEPARAIADWNAGLLDALVVPHDELPRLLRDLPGAVPSRSHSWRNDSDPMRGYVLLMRP